MSSITTFELPSTTTEGIELLSYVALPKNIENKPTAGILIAPEWWGVVDHPIEVAKKLANLGFAAVVMDIYGGGKITTDAIQANAWMSQMLEDQTELMARCSEILADFSKQVAVDANRLGVIGYCFGGKIALDMAREGMPLKAVATFHGNPAPKQPAKPDTFSAKVLVAHGKDDSFVSMEAIEGLKAELDQAKVDYTINIYEGAKHGFSNPHANERAKENGVDLAYNENAANASWEKMVNFMKKTLA
ncbi:MAG: dienelactone hydrolase [Gammaproteobacteria bacterium]|nr:MAG: dienelactone hydrolase [Gammaproteobacteria bacterium]